MCRLPQSNYHLAEVYTQQDSNVSANCSTWHPRATRRKSSTSVEMGADPVMTNLTRPPNRFWIFPKTSQSQRESLRMMPLGDSRREGNCKHPWALVIHGPKIRGGYLHGGDICMYKDQTIVSSKMRGWALTWRWAHSQDTTVMLHACTERKTGARFFLPSDLGQFGGHCSVKQPLLDRRC